MSSGVVTSKTRRREKTGALTQEERSHRSRAHVLEAALELFSHRGYGATSIRDIAEAAGLSAGNVYHHFDDKEAIFQELLDQYWAAIDSEESVFNKALASGPIPDSLEAIGFAARDWVDQWRRHVALIYVDVVEFEGSHIRRFYANMATSFQRFAERNKDLLQAETRLRPGITPGAALMLATRFFMNYFAVELLFGVPDHFGKDTRQVIHEIADVLRNGMAATATSQ